MIDVTIFSNISKYKTDENIPININISDLCNLIEQEVLGGGVIILIILILLYILIFLLCLVLLGFLIWFLASVSPAIIKVLIIVLRFVGRRILKYIRNVTKENTIRYINNKKKK